MHDSVDRPWGWIIKDTKSKTIHYHTINWQKIEPKMLHYGYYSNNQEDTLGKKNSSYIIQNTHRKQNPFQQHPERSRIPHSAFGQRIWPRSAAGFSHVERTVDRDLIPKRKQDLYDSVLFLEPWKPLCKYRPDERVADDEIIWPARQPLSG